MPEVLTVACDAVGCEATIHLEFQAGKPFMEAFEVMRNVLARTGWYAGFDCDRCPTHAHTT